jgi:molybdate transport system ATP-binding protein
MSRATSTEPIAPYLNVQMRHRIGALELDVDFKLDKPWTILFGPSGSGKTTILRVLTGLVSPDEALIECTAASGRPRSAKILFNDTRTKRHLAPCERGIGFAPQQASLFPHMSVMENVGYGIKIPPHGEPENRRAYLNSILETLRLSGGEAQRANLARALATKLAVPSLSCNLFLFDEPFTGLEAGLRDELISDLREWLSQAGIPVLSVTHDVAEAFQLGAEVIKLAEGRVVAQGPVEVVLAEERKRLLAQLGEPTSQNRDVGHPQSASTEPYLSG